MPTYNLTATQYAGGSIDVVDANYLTARSGGGTADTLTVAAIDWSLFSGDYYTTEGFVRFDTSSIPTSETVTSVSLSWPVDTGSSIVAAAFDAVIRANTDWADTLVVGDWVPGADLTTYTEVGSTTVGTSPSNPTIFTLSAAAIVKGGVTRLMVHARGLEGTTEPTTDHYLVLTDMNTTTLPTMTVETEVAPTTEELVLDSVDGIEWGRTYRIRVRAMPAS